MLQKEKKPYLNLELEIVLFEESFIRTSYGNDDNDGYWEDENTKPIGSF